ncbi:hypothetical protein ACGFIR_00285 [Micromonospora sp. NPDC049051]|uniref:hypothetical protein n=1 Tax=unclassified Micromonospora TaxID=2617518 RepID=UPI00370FBB14
MTTARSRLLRAALAPVVGIGLVLGCVACSTGAESSAGSGAGQWQDYDRKMESWLGCLRANGMPDAKYAGHHSSAMNAKMEIDGIPSGAIDSHAAWAQCRAQQPAEADRPEPYLKYEMSPEELKNLRAIARCVRERGFADYPDPNPNPEYQTPGRYNSLKKLPEVEKAYKDCVKELGIPMPDGG